MTETVSVTRLEIAAARAFQGGKSLRKIAEILNITTEQADTWLDSERCVLACSTIKRANAHPRKPKP